MAWRIDANGGTPSGNDDLGKEVGLHIVANLDLIRLAAKPESAKHPDLVQAIQRAASAGSTREDLRAAAVALDLIETIIDRREMDTGVMPTGQWDGTVVGSLFTEAIVLYARATTTGGDRPRLLGEAKLSPDQRAVHNEAIKMRDSAIAHFGRGDFLKEGPLLRQAVLVTLIRTPDGPKHRAGVYTTRAKHKAAFANRLAGLIETRLHDLEQKTQTLFDAANAALDAALKADPAFGSAVRDSEFDVDAFCSSSDAAELMRAQLAIGEMEDMDYAVRVSRSGRPVTLD